MYNPFSVYTSIPWAIIFNVIEAIIMIVLDAAIGSGFNNIVKGVFCIILFILNYVYIIYTIYIHFKILFKKESIQQLKLEEKKQLYPITFTDLFNIIISNGLIWNWFFMSLFFFDKNFYTDVVDNQPRMFFKVYFKFYAYTLIGTNAGTTTIMPIQTFSELVTGLSVLNYQIFTVLVIAGFLSYLIDKLKELLNGNNKNLNDNVIDMNQFYKINKYNRIL